MLSKREFKVYADLGIDSRLLTRRLMILHRGLAPNLISIDELPSGYERTLEPVFLPSFSDGNNRPCKLVVYVSPFVRLGKLQAERSFFVYPGRAAPVFLGREFFDVDVESVHVERKEVMLMDAMRVPILRKRPKRVLDAVPVPSFRNNLK